MFRFGVKTNAGNNAIANAVGGQTLTITRMEYGKGMPLAVYDITDENALKEVMRTITTTVQKMADISISGREVSNNVLTLFGEVDAESVTEDFDATELSVFAKVGDSEEILFAYFLANDCFSGTLNSTADPVLLSGLAIQPYTVKVLIATNDSENITVNLSGDSCQIDDTKQSNQKTWSSEKIMQEVDAIAHTHNNITTLAKISESEDNTLLFNGKRIGGSAQKQVITFSGTETELKPNEETVFPVVQSLKIVLPEETKNEHFFFTFKSGSTSPALTLPDGITTDLVTEAYKFYEVSIYQGRMLYACFDMTEAQKQATDSEEQAIAEAAAALAEAKTTAINELTSYKSLDDYRVEQQTEITGILETATAEINGVTDASNIGAIVETAKGSLDTIKTDAQFTAEEELAAFYAGYDFVIDSDEKLAQFAACTDGSMQEVFIEEGNYTLTTPVSFANTGTTLLEGRGANKSFITLDVSGSYDAALDCEVVPLSEAGGTLATIKTMGFIQKGNFGGGSAISKATLDRSVLYVSGTSDLMHTGLFNCNATKSAIIADAVDGSFIGCSNNFAEVEEGTFLYSTTFNSTSAFFRNIAENANVIAFSNMNRGMTDCYAWIDSPVGNYGFANVCMSGQNCHTNTEIESGRETYFNEELHCEKITENETAIALATNKLGFDATQVVF